jgi:hypothetical protein
LKCYFVVPLASREYVYPQVLASVGVFRASATHCATIFPIVPTRSDLLGCWSIGKDDGFNILQWPHEITLTKYASR